MLETFYFGFNIVMPMMLLMLLGYYLRHKGIFDVQLLKKMNSFAFNYCIPALMFNNVYSLKNLEAIPLRLMAFMLSSLVILTFLGIVLAKIFGKNSGQKAVIVQMSFRSNYAVVGAALAMALGGLEGSGVSASLQAPTILYFNIMAVVCLTIWSNNVGAKISFCGIISSVITNPLILAQIAAMFCLLLRGYMPLNEANMPVFTLANNLPWLYGFLKELTKMASPLVLILLGAQINFGAVGDFKVQLVLCNVMRLISAPALGLGMAWWAHGHGYITLTPAVVSALLPLYGSPSPAAAAVMAENMDCDGELARQGVVWTTALSLISLMLWIVFLRNLGWV